MKKGFTLIELLAVIVILAIIAVIAVPIVIDIIDDSKKNASLRSAEMYMDAVEMSVANSSLKEKNIQDETYNILSTGNICLEYNDDNITCKDELKVEVNGETPKEGTITITNGNISNVDFKINEKRIVKNSKDELIYFPCTLISGEANTIGSKYECEVKSGTKYNFYVLSYNNKDNESTNDKQEAVTTNLIMDRNMCSDETPTKKGKTCLVAWYSTSQTNEYGPVTAMDYLYNATKNWINIPNIEINYTDE